MDRRFWLDRWSKNKIGFHQDTFNPHLVEHWPGLGLPDTARVFVPLCGKSKDMSWLAGRGHDVYGIELSELAVASYFEEAREPTRRQEIDGLVAHHGETACIYQGDFFDLTAPHLAGVKACYDRGALVALPQDMRARYVDHLLRVLDDGVQILLLSVAYDQSIVAGPPHSVRREEVERLYAGRCSVVRLDARATDVVPPHFAQHGVPTVTETVYHITKLG